jgi:WD40 repeat protein
MCHRDYTFSVHTFSVLCVLQLSDGRLVSGSNDNTLILWKIKSVEQQRWERRRYFLLLIDSCYILSATDDNPLLLRRRRDSARLDQLIRCLLQHSDILQLILTACEEGDRGSLVVHPSISEIFANRGVVELITKFI